MGHDEYWSRQMYDHAMAARDSGVNLLFLSGNAVSGDVYLKPSPDGRPNAIMGRIDRYKDENKLMGAKSYGVGLGAFRCEEPNHWLFNGTGMKKGDTIANLIGWEYHGFHVAEYPSLKVLATGPMVFAEDFEVYATTIYEMPKGNFVFNAATCWWSMPLSTPPVFPDKLNPNSSYHGKAFDFYTKDPRVQRMTENLLNRALGK